MSFALSSSRSDRSFDNATTQITDPTDPTDQPLIIPVENPIAKGEQSDGSDRSVAMLPYSNDIQNGNNDSSAIAENMYRLGHSGI